MGKLEALILKISLGIFAAVNFTACIITTDPKVLIPLNIAVAILCLGIVLFMESKVAGLSKDLGIPKSQARKLIGDYFNYYKNVDRVSIDEYLARLEKKGDDSRRP
jgi:hypothetical protein